MRIWIEAMHKYEALAWRGVRTMGIRGMEKRGYLLPSTQSIKHCSI